MRTAREFVFAAICLSFISAHDVFGNVSVVVRLAPGTGCYALSVSVSPKADKLWTGLITPTDDGKGGTRYRLFVKQKFASIAELIKYYHTSPCVTIDKGKREVMLVDVL